MNQQQCILFGKCSANIGADQGEIESYRENVVDTLTDVGADEWLHDALQAFDQRITQLHTAA